MPRNEKEKGPGTYNCHIDYLESRLTLETARLASGYDAICIFVNDEANKDVIEILHEEGIRLILLRCAGFNNVDIETCNKYGITVTRVPAYSPYAVAKQYGYWIVREYREAYGKWQGFDLCKIIVDSPSRRGYNT